MALGAFVNKMRWQIDVGFEIFREVRCTWNCCALYMDNQG
jgi:hypothetical protein